MRRVLCAVSFSCILSLLFSFTVHLPPKITLRVEQASCIEGQPIALAVTIDHMRSDEVDLSSFTLDGKAVAAREVTFQAVGSSPSLDAFITSTYTVFWPSHLAGIYTIGPIEVQVGGIKYQSNSTTLNVLPSVVTKDFALTATVDAPKTIYPGQKIRVQYQLRTPQDVQLLKEDLPLLRLEGFIPTSSVEVEDKQIGNNLFVETMQQEFRSVSSGVFQVGVSRMEGMRSGTNEGGQQTLIPPLLVASVEPKTIIVTPFPEKDKPDSFTGAIGSFIFRGRIVGSNEVKVGEPITVEWRATGRGDIETVHLPDLSTNSLFAARFTVEGSPKETLENDSKTFTVLLRPLIADLRQVPGFLFSSFDPDIKKYIVVLTPPLALHVAALAPEQIKAENTSSMSGRFLLPYDPVLSQAISQTLPLSLGLVWGWGAGFGALSWGFYWVIQKRRKGPRVKHGKGLYYQAFAKRHSPKLSLSLLKDALLLRLYEVGLTEQIMTKPNELSQYGVVGEVRHIIETIEDTLFGGTGGGIPFNAIWKEASLVFHTLKSMPEVHREK